jgi:hypothetical protein
LVASANIAFETHLKNLQLITPKHLFVKKLFKNFYPFIKVLLPTDAQNNCFKRILKFTLKQLQHVSVLSPSSGNVLFELAKVTFVKTVH